MRRATIRTSALGLVALTVTVTLTTLMWQGGTAAARVNEPVVVSSNDARRLLAVAGIEPRALAAAGASINDTSQIVGQARTYLAHHLSAIDESIQAASAAALRAARRSPEETQSVVDLRAAAATARAARDSALASFRSAALNGINEGIIAKLNNIRANRDVGLPMQYLVMSQTPEEWAALRNGLAAAKTAEKRGSLEPQSMNSSVSEAQSDSAVSAAAQALDPANVAAIKTAWNTAIAASPGGGQ